MYHLTILMRIWMIVAALLTVAGCATTPTPNFYHLDESVSTDLAGLQRGIAIGVGPVIVEPYLDRPQIVIRGTGHKIELSEFNRWVEPLKDSILRVIIVNLSNMVQSNRVFDIPNRRPIPFEFKVEIEIVRFDGELGGDATLVSRWTLYGRQEKALLTKVSIVSEPSGGEGFDNLVAAQNRTLQKLSQEIVDAIKANQ